MLLPFCRTENLPDVNLRTMLGLLGKRLFLVRSLTLVPPMPVHAYSHTAAPHASPDLTAGHPALGFSKPVLQLAHFVMPIPGRALPVAALPPAHVHDLGTLTNMEIGIGKYSLEFPAPVQHLNCRFM